MLESATSPIVGTQIRSAVDALTGRRRGRQLTVDLDDTVVTTDAATAQVIKDIEKDLETLLRQEVPLPSDTGAGRVGMTPSPPRTTVVMQIVVSLVALAAGLFSLSEGSADQQKLAAGWVGLVLGYWLR